MGLNVSQEPKPTDINPHDGSASSSHLTGHPQHGPIATHDDGEISVTGQDSRVAKHVDVEVKGQRGRFVGKNFPARCGN